ncbi:hypothetical protein KVH02_11660 [Streptomyces olivaceus]|uniref:Uncharacterized protein n=1 Tax=Streptomyces olivaceus TaxID=47716 RepID=A0ABS7W0H8_STROV|nr:hypothetical protein [Streptomyces olivaceus]MBZ6088977.1 hypothetical protein [Streptomyces olivaceus]MBZ6095649.1 hypothetical protein [Streptomyces olivaceus]MBZ6119918.1 hypothetical protein [Streptomyces olivaceus]MBZ6151469.1 hypothetical protein [Streptomyces olivaceus]MBZ6298409.1 hypothetical protein [Streptomyces olivaceus]
MTDYQRRRAAFLAMPDEALERPLWEIPPADRLAFMSARDRRRALTGRTPADTDETHARITDLTEVE